MFLEIKKLHIENAKKEFYSEAFVKTDAEFLLLKFDSDAAVIDEGSDKPLILKDVEISEIDKFYSSKADMSGEYIESIDNNLILESSNGILTLRRLDNYKKVSTIRHYNKEQWNKILTLSI